MLQEAGRRSEGKDPEQKHAEIPDIEERKCGTSIAERETNHLFPRRGKRTKDSGEPAQE